MSYRLQDAAWEVECENGGAKLVLHAICKCYNDETHQCNPSITHLVKLTGLSESTITRAIASLMSSSLLARRRGYHATSHYVPLPDPSKCGIDSAEDPSKCGIDSNQTVKMMDSLGVKPSKCGHLETLEIESIPQNDGTDPSKCGVRPVKITAVKGNEKVIENEIPKTNELTSIAVIEPAPVEPPPPSHPQKPQKPQRPVSEKKRIMQADAQAANAYPVPDILAASPDFVEAWQDWKEWRTKAIITKDWPWTRNCARNDLLLCERLGIGRAVEALRHSTDKYRGIFHPDNSKFNRHEPRIANDTPSLGLLDTTEYRRKNNFDANVQHRASGA